jgi:hypothetical protein
VYCATCGRKLKASGGASRQAYECAYRRTPLDRDYHVSFRVELLDRPILAAMWRRLPNGLIEGAIARLEQEQVRHTDVADLNDRGRKALQRKVDGLVEMTLEPGLSADARQMLVERLNEATKALKQLERQVAPTPHLDAEVAAYQEMLGDEAKMALLPSIWDDEPIQWRRDFIARLIQRVDVRASDTGEMTVAVTWADGEVTELASKVRRPLSDTEIALIKAALASPECPATRKDVWIANRLQAAGYDRNAYTVGNALRRIARRDADCT